MAKKYLDSDGLLYFWGKLKAYFVPQTRKVNGKALSSDITLSASDVSALPSSTTIPSAGTGDNYPTMDGARALGSNAGYARVDHVHPSDTTRVPTTRTINGHALSANITLDADDVGALPDSTVIPTKTSDLTNDSDFVSDASYVHTDSNYTATEKSKLAGIAAGAEVNVQADWNESTTTSDAYIKNKPTIPSLKNVFGIVKVGTTNIEADNTRDTLTLEAGSNVTLTPDATNDKVTIAATDTTYSDFAGATVSDAGTHGLVPAPASGDGMDFLLGDGSWNMVRIKESGGTVIDTPVLSGGYYDTTLANATTSAGGLMSGSDKSKLDGIESGAEKNVVTYVNGSSTVGGTAVVSIRLANGNVFDTLKYESKGSANGVCPLNASSKIDSTYLPSYVDDVIEAYPISGATELSSTWLSTTSGGSALTPETGKIYVLMEASTNYAANSQFRWSGTTYVKLSDGGVSEITNAEIDTIVAS